MQISYFIQDLADPAVGRRVETLIRGGGRLRLIGFRRIADAVPEVAGTPALDLGRTSNGRLVARIGSVARAAAGIAGWGWKISSSRVVLARNLDMLLLAYLARLLYCRSADLVYELLDIHALMTGASIPARLLRMLEGFLLRRCRYVIVSSPAFAEQYLSRYHPDHPPAVLVENKVLVADGARRPVLARPQTPPWRIGWFGNLRCRRSLDCLIAVARRFPDKVAIDIRGKIASAEVETLPAEVAGLPNVRFLGPYTHGDLRQIYAAVQFTWAVDFFGAGLNPTCLLPNRLYEGCYWGSVPIAVSGTQTGRWLQQNLAGVLLDEPLEACLGAFLCRVTTTEYRRLADRVGAIAPAALSCDAEECRSLMALLAGRPVPPRPQDTSVLRKGGRM